MVLQIRQLVLSIGIVLLAGSLITVPSTASTDYPPRPDPGESGLDENETATLWSKLPNECRSDEEYYEQHGENRTDMQELGECTDISFAEPPDTAAIWTAADFDTLEAGDRNTSVYPASAETQNSSVIAEAHATSFAVQPSTIVHQDEMDTPQYVAPDGEFRGFVDYRVRAPGSDNSTFSSDWSVLEHGIDEVRLKQDGETISTQDGTHTPVLEYALDGNGPSTLTFEADIEVWLERELTDGNQTETEVDNLIISNDLEVEVYDLSASIYYAEYPDGDTGIAIYQAQPWHGYILSEDGDAAVRGNWRYYTARDTDWDHFVESSATDSVERHSEALPVFVRAYPSEAGPRADPIYDGPDIVDVWGSDRPSPNETIHEHVDIDVLEEPYTRSYGLAVRYDEFDRDHLEVQGIVRGTTAELVEPEGGAEREIRESELSVDILDQDESTMTIEVSLHDAETGNPIMLEDPFENDPRFEPIGGSSRDGYISIAGERLETNITGQATATLTQPGIHTAEYHPDSWRTNDPAYVGDTASVSWHPLTTASGWFTLFVDLVWLSIPFLVALYAGLKLGSFLRIPDEHNP
ncbi:hypothetical protein [Natronolimnobius sp. AArcel1]|uniref:hypothetical protein n=1 Tax=Natronolimnobius sp. AArcel1 TaxID=1679093 RepID=UPI0019D0DD53|nr:hypothetical protein [Natronolimnobius sp. AArcel1]